MIAYVETNFVLELALLQEEHGFCEAILGLAGAGEVSLAVPAFALVEPYATLVRRHRERSLLSEGMSREFRQLARTRAYQARVRAMDDVVSLMAESAAEEKDRLDRAAAMLLGLADTIPLDADVLRSGMAFQQDYDLSPFDGIVLASVISHLDAFRPPASCLITRNATDFGKPHLQALLDDRRCKLLYRFEDALGYVRSKLSKGP